MACLILKTSSVIREEDFSDFFEKKKWGERTYPFVDHYDPSCLAWVGNISYWIESDAIEVEVEKETGVPRDEQVLLDKMPDIAKERWITVAQKIAGITNEEIDAALPGLIARMPGQREESDVWKTYFRMKRDYIKAVVDAGITEVEVFI